MKNDFLKRNLQLLSTIVAALILFVVFSIIANNFSTVNNTLNIALQSSIIAIVAIGQTFVIAGGGIDLSVGPVVAIGSVVTAILLNSGFPIWSAVVIGLFCCIICGLINGLIITYWKIAPFIATLGTQLIFRGIVYVITNGVPVSGLPSEFSLFGLGKLFDVIPYPVIAMLVITIIFTLIMTKSKFGRLIFAIGSNEKTAFLSGVNVSVNKILMYVLCSFLSGLGGIILTSRLVSAQPTTGTGYEANAIAAAVIGGASLAGGTGSIIGAVVGALIMGILQNGLNLIGLSYFLQQIAIGSVIILAVMVDKLRNRFSKNNSY